MKDVVIVDGVRSAIGKYGGGLSGVRPDDLLAEIYKGLIERTGIDPALIDDVYAGCGNQAGEDNRNVARMASLLSGLPHTVPGATVNRLCGSGLDAIGIAARAVKSGEQQLVIAGGVESMSRAPFVMGKSTAAFSRSAEIFDTTIGWRFVNEILKGHYGIDSMPETAENVAEKYQISREDQDKFALRSQQKALKAISNGRMSKEITYVKVKQKRSDDLHIDKDEHPRETTNEKLSNLPTPFKINGTVTAGNSSGVNDGAAALIIADEEAIKKHNLTPIAKIISAASSGVQPSYMGIGPVTASQKVLKKSNLNIDNIDVLEINEAFAAQVLACLREFGVSDNDERVNPNGGAIALGHPLGMSGTRLVLTAAKELEITNKKYALCTMCVGVGQGSAIILEKV